MTIRKATLWALAAALPLSAAVMIPEASASVGPDQKYVSYTASNGAASNYHYYPSGKEGSGLIVYLDGDGQWGHDHPTDNWALGGNNGVVAEGRERGLDVMSVKTPNRDKTWWTTCDRNATYLKDLLAKVTTERNINLDDIWITGYSGGAQFTTQCYLPKYGNTIKGGGTVVFGGGGMPETRVTPFTDATKQNLTLNWITGTEDIAANSNEDYDALGYAKDGARWYRNQGFKTWEYYPVGVDHNEIGTQFGKYIGEAIDRDRADNGTPVTPPVTPTPTPTPTPKPTTPVTTSWGTNIVVGKDYADITVNIPTGLRSNSTMVRIDGPGGTYWYEYAYGSGLKTVRMGDPGDMLSPGTTYTYKIVNKKTTYATGTFTTLK